MTDYPPSCHQNRWEDTGRDPSLQACVPVSREKLLPQWKDRLKADFKDKYLVEPTQVFEYLSSSTSSNNYTDTHRLFHHLYHHPHKDPVHLKYDPLATMEFYITAALGLFAVITLGSPVSEADMVGRDIEDRAAAPFLRFYDKINQNVPIGNFDFPDELDNKCGK